VAAAEQREHERATPPVLPDFTRYACEDLDAVAKALNERPRKTLGYKTPAEALNEHLVLVQNTGVATTG